MILAESATHLRVRADREAFRRLEAAGIFFGAERGCYPPDGTVIGVPIAPSSEPFTGYYGSRWIGGFGFASYSHSPVSAPFPVGRYCSIAAGLRVMNGDHPLERFTTHTLTYLRGLAAQQAAAEALGGAATPLPHAQKPHPVIEDDVWIGQDVILARGIKLGTGCVIAAGAVVTRDVPPYAVVGGVPARRIRDRFPPALAEAMLRLRWWRFAWPHFADLVALPPAEFLKRLEAREAEGTIRPYAPPRVDAAGILRGLAAERGALDEALRDIGPMPA